MLNVKSSRARAGEAVCILVTLLLIVAQSVMGDAAPLQDMGDYYLFGGDIALFKADQ
jgi:hypothetical protein